MTSPIRANETGVCRYVEYGELTRKRRFLDSVPLRLDRETLSELRRFGIDIERVCTTALEAELIRARAQVAQADDYVLHQRGFAAGVEWASLRGRPAELDVIRNWAAIRWQQFSLVPCENSFVYAFCEATRRGYPIRDEPFYFISDAFTRGMIEGAASVRSPSNHD